MSSIGTKPARLRLDPMSYGNLRQQVLRRGTLGCDRPGKGNGFGCSRDRKPHSIYRNHDRANRE
jgi:hypothetical protein